MDIDIEKFKNKDPESRQAVFQRFYPTLMFVVVKILNKKETAEQDADEIVFRCLTTVCDFPEKFDTLQMIASNLYVNAFYFALNENMRNGVEPYNDSYWNVRYKTDATIFLQLIIRAEVLTFYDQNPDKLKELQEQYRMGNTLIDELLLNGSSIKQNTKKP